MGKVLIHNTHGKDDVELGNTGFRGCQCRTDLRGGRHGDAHYRRGCGAPPRVMPMVCKRTALHPLPTLSRCSWTWEAIFGCAARAPSPRNITADHLLSGAQLVGAVAAIEVLVNGAQTLSW